ncbi:hypothetical protein GEMRC1_008432 [Eukaryota sp. GEM-RC1]
MTEKFSIGQQSYDVMNRHIYVDKTRHLVELAQDECPFCLSRPGRIGKSLLTSTLSKLFAGNKDFFENTFAYKNWDWSTTYPVIHLDFSGCSIFSREELRHDLLSKITAVAKPYGVSFRTDVTPHDALSILIETLSLNTSLPDDRVVLLIDEYDAPLLDALNSPIFEEVKQVMSPIFNVIKSADEYLRFTFLTGVTQFSKSSLFLV